jgi:hypothetical protein
VNPGAVDPDDGDQRVVRLNDLANDTRVVPEASTPILRADRRNRRRIRLIIIGEQSSPCHRPHAEQLVVIAGRQVGRGDLGMAINDHVDGAHRRAGRQFNQRPIGLPQVQKERIRECRACWLVRGGGDVAVLVDVVRHAVAPVVTQSHERVRIVDGNLAQQQAIGGTE